MKNPFAKKPAATLPKSELVELYRKALKSGVPIDVIERKVDQWLARTEVTSERESQYQLEHKRELQKKLPWMVRMGSLAVPVLMIVGGLGLISSAVLPIASYYIGVLPGLQASALMAPVPDEKVLDVNPIVIAQAPSSQPANNLAVDQAIDAPLIMDNQLDYTNLSNWFAADQAQILNTDPNSVQTYVLDIPSLDIKNATVAIGGTDLNHGLIQYPGTALPGEQGAPVIFGHSVLRQFYNPSEKNSRRYMSIFSTIMTLKPKADIYVTYQGIKYHYQVQDKLEVKPTDTYILNQKYDTKTLKLVTCTPEGTTLRRGIVIGQLVATENQ